MNHGAGGEAKPGPPGGRDGHEGADAMRCDESIPKWNWRKWLAMMSHAISCP